MNRIVRIGSLLAIAALMSACGHVKYQCPMPSGVSCMSAAQVYQVTDAPGKEGMNAAAGVMEKKGHLHPNGVVVPDSAGTTSGRDYASDGDVMPLPKAGDVIPIREQARVMRIWIGPWIDNNGNLAMATRVYTEIEPKRWSVGTEAEPTATNFFPLQVDSAPASSPGATTETSNSAVTPDAQVTAIGRDGQTP